MPRLTQGTWIVVADGEKALFLENGTDHDDPNFSVLSKEEQENPPNREQAANRRGRMQEGRPGGEGGGPRSAFDDTDWHQLAKDRFAQDLADMLYKRAHAGAFDSLVLVAAPGVLGELRDALHAEVRDRIVCEIPKTLTNHGVAEIEKIVRDDMAG